MPGPLGHCVTIGGIVVDDARSPGRGQKAYARAPAEGGAKGSVVIFCDTKYTKKSVSSVEAGVDIEGQIMCVEQCTF